MVIARSIYNSDAQILAQTGLVLTADAIARLDRLGIASVYIRNSWASATAPRQAITESLRVKTVAMVKTNFDNVHNQLRLNIGQFRNTIREIIDELLADDDILVELTDIRTFDDYLFAHSVNVCILSLMTGITMNYDRARLTELAIGALLHDIGKTRVDPEILNKPDDLSADEFTAVKQHTLFGFEILRSYASLSLLSAHIALQHHERWDGRGYPRGLAGRAIHEYARIVAAADAYDALLADRPYRPAYTVKQALTIIERMSGTYLDPELATALTSNIAVYPVGSLVKVSTGYIGLVKTLNKAVPTRPILSIIMDNTGRPLSRTHEVDLSQFTTIVILRALTNEEINNLDLENNV